METGENEVKGEVKGEVERDVKAKGEVEGEVKVKGEVWVDPVTGIARKRRLSHEQAVKGGKSSAALRAKIKEANKNPTSAEEISRRMDVLNLKLVEMMIKHPELAMTRGGSNLLSVINRRLKDRERVEGGSEEEGEEESGGGDIWRMAAFMEEMAREAIAAGGRGSWSEDGGVIGVAGLMSAGSGEVVPVASALGPSGVAEPSSGVGGQG